METLPLDPVFACIVFGSAFGIDVMSTLYTRRAVEGKAIQAAIASAALLVLSSITLYGFIENPLMAIPEICGAALGTYVTVKFDCRKKVTV